MKKAIIFTAITSVFIFGVVFSENNKIVKHKFISEYFANSLNMVDTVISQRPASWD